MDASIPRPDDVLAVRSRVSWPAIAAGAMIATAIYFVLTLLGAALGLEVAVRGATAHLGAGAAIYSVLSLLLAMFFGGWSTSRLAVGESKVEALLYGVILWGTLFLGLVWLFSVGIRTGFGAMVGLSSGAYSLAIEGDEAGGPPSHNLVESLRRRYNTELGGEKFVADLQKAGFTEEQAKKAQTEIKGTIDRLHDDPSSLPEVARDVASRPEVQEAAGQATRNARQATWWTLLGVITSMAAVITGSLVGSGELLQPVPLLGVRRPARLG
ncbi:hypothetical protein V5E97_27150 [Singulisphaera sp. Ch08]|uniref:DUF1707 domain-containing protein n=1 Tax=Singulisphaera sp. Ch08 TaxID=3120278 RepID=A0AAU7CA04_9BACT